MRRLLAQLSTQLALLLALSSPAAIAAPSLDLWPRWQAHDPQSQDIVDHRDWSAFLRRYVRENADQVNRVAYGEVHGSDRALLEGYLAQLQTINPDQLNRDEQKAYWLNLYNAQTVRLVLDHYPVKSIRQIKLSGWFKPGPWDARLLLVNNEALSLNDIEHRILRPIWRDPLIHYGVNCASLGCPNLLTQAYRGDRVDQQLAENATTFINSMRGVMLGKRGLKVSSIYKWFADDFGDSRQLLFEHLRKYANADLSDALDNTNRIQRYGYDWALNDT